MAGRSKLNSLLTKKAFSVSLHPSSAYFAALFILSACRVGGGLSAGLEAVPAPKPIITIPTIVSPASNPFYSKDNSITLTGQCMYGQTVALNGASSQQANCGEDSSFNFVVEEKTDGVYTLLVTQIDANHVVSKPASFVWIRKTSIAPPLVSTPGSTPFGSALPALVISGSCESSARVVLSGDGSGGQTCANSAFSIVLPKGADGDYNIVITQTDAAGNSASTPIQWQKHAVTATPSTPEIQVATNQTFVLSGGSGSYAFTIETNNSGGVLNAATKTYTAGNTAYVTDRLKVTDSLGTATYINLTTKASTADHLELSDGDAQQQAAGSVLTKTLKAKVVDRYSNGIPAIDIVFHSLDGDAVVTSLATQTSNASGFVEVNAQLGFASPNSHIEARPLNSALPDVAATGHAKITFTLSATVQGHGPIGLNFGVGNKPNAMVSSDFNADGKLDIAVLNSDDNKVGILYGVGNGLFSTQTTYSLGSCSQGSSLTMADVNGDTKADLLVACFGTSSIYKLLNDGNGGFTLGGSVITANAPSALVIADFNGDGIADLAYTSVDSGGVGLVTTQLGNGDGTFQTAVDNIVGLTPSSLVAVDLNQDSIDDLVVANSGSSNVSVLLGVGNGTFSAAVNSSVDFGPVKIVAADFDGDGFMDIATANGVGNSVSVLLNDQAGGLAASADTPIGLEPNSLNVSDLNADGFQDLIFTTSTDSSLGVLPGLGTGLFSTPQSYSTMTDPISTLVLDANGDGKKDIYVASSGNQVVQGFLANQVASYGLYSNTGVAPAAVFAADFDGDGKIDQAIVNTTSNSVTLLKGLGNGLFIANGTLSTGAAPVSITGRDLNHDGKIDLVVSNQNVNSVGVFLGHGDGTFTVRTDYPVANHPVFVAIQDLNNDGFLDLVVANNGSSNVSVLTGKGDGTFNAKSDFSTGPNPTGIAIADLNRDGAVDVAVSNSGDNTVSILLGNGDATLRAQSVELAGAQPAAIAAEDVNADGIIDVIVLNAGDRSVGILKGKGDGSFYLQDAYEAGDNLASLAMGDFDGDGRMDIAVSNANLGTDGSPGTVSILLNNGNGTFGNANAYGSSGTLTGLTVSDFNNDGKLDISVLDSTNGRAQIWLGR